MDILIVDDHKLFNDGFKSILSQNQLFGNIYQLYHSVDVIPFLQITPAIEFIFLDINMPVQNGVDLAREILYKFPLLKILIVTTHIDLIQINQLKKIGVHGYILKIEDINEVIKAVKMIQNGISHYHDEEIIIATNNKLNIKNSLTARELEVLILIKNGKSTYEISKELNVSGHTVITHRKNLHLKLDITNERDLVRLAVEMGL
jgi:DNA-binding NarL/FixJ family response regulator